MANLTVEHNTAVSVNAGTSYFLTVVIGNGQVGSSDFTNLSGTEFSPDVVNAPLGDGAALKGKSLKVLSEVMQVNPASMTLIVTYYITDHQIINIDDENATDSVSFEATAGQTILFITTLTFS